MTTLTVREKNGTPYSPALVELWNIGTHPPLMTPHPDGGTYVYVTNSENSYPIELVVNEDMQDIISLSQGKQQWYLLDVVSKNGNPITPTRQFAVPVSRVRKVLPTTYDGQLGHNYFFNHGGSGQPANWEFIALGAIPTPVINTCAAVTNINTSVTVGANGFAQLAVNFTPPSGITSSTPKYNLVVINLTTGYQASKQYNNENIIFEGLNNNGSQYGVRIVSTCENGSALPSADFPIVVSVGANIAAVTGVNTTSVTSTAATINFTAPAQAGVSYQIIYTNTSTSASFTDSSSNSPFSLTGLSPNTLYSFKIRQFINGNPSSETTSFNFTTLP